MTNLTTRELFNIQHVYLPAEIANMLAETNFCWEALPKIKSTLKQLIAKIPVDQRIQGSVASTAILKSDEIVVEKGAVVEDLAYIDGPTYIAKDAVVRHGAYLRGGVYLGVNCIAGHTTEIKDSLLLANAKAAHFAYLGNSVLGCDVNLGAGTKLANLRLDHKNIVIKQGAQTIDTGLKKFGAIFGDKSQSGCNAVTNPGTIIMPESAIFPTKNASGIVSNHYGRVKPA